MLDYKIVCVRERETDRQTDRQRDVDGLPVPPGKLLTLVAW